MAAPASIVTARPLGLRRPLAAALVALSILVAAGFGSTLAAPGAQAATASTRSVQVVPSSPTANCTPPAGYCFEPPTVGAAAGDTVTWSNTTGVSHTVTRCPTQPTSACPQGSGDGKDPINGSLAPAGGNGATYSVTLSSPGSYYYYCTIHTYMHGLVTVSAATPTPSPTGPTQFSPVPGSTPPPDTATPTPTPTPSPSPSDTPSASPSDALTSPSVSPGTSPSDTPVAGSTGTGTGTGTGSGGSPLVPIVLIIIALLAIGGGVLSYRFYRGSRLPPTPPGI